MTAYPHAAKPIVPQQFRKIQYLAGKLLLPRKIVDNAQNLYYTMFGTCTSTKTQKTKSQTQFHSGTGRAGVQTLIKYRCGAVFNRRITVLYIFKKTSIKGEYYHGQTGNIDDRPMGRYGF
jgi:hypothetical protein